MKELLCYLIAGTRGGPTRANIIQTIKNKPMNIHQISQYLNLDYKTVQHHIKILEKNNIFVVIKKGSYGAMYFLSEDIKANWNYLEEIWVQFGNKPGKS